MAASNQTFARRFTTAAELAFNQNLLWGNFSNTNYQVAAQGLDSLDIFLPDTSGIVETGAGTNTGTLIDGGIGANWAATTRNQDALTPRDITTIRKRMFLREVGRDSVTVGVDDQYDVPVDMIAAAGRASGELMAEVIDNYKRNQFRTTVAANRTAVGGAAQFCTITGANRGKFETAAGTVSDDQSTLYEALEYAQLDLRVKSIVDTGTVDRTPFMVMHPVRWFQLQRYAVDKNFRVDRFGRYESGDDVVASRAVGKMFGFNIYVDPNIALVGATPDYVPIMYGTPEALTFALSDMEAKFYDGAPGTWKWQADYRRRFGTLLMRPELSFELRVAAAAD